MLPALGCAPGEKRPPDASAAVRREAARRAPLLTDDEPFADSTFAAVGRFYAAAGFAPAWSRNLTITPQAFHMVQALRAVEHEGLDPNRYDVAWLTAQLGEARDSAAVLEPDAVAVFDVRLTNAYFLCAYHLMFGRVPPDSLDHDWWSAKQGFDPGPRLEDALANDRVRGVLSAFTPRDPAYARLREQLATYKAWLAAGGWPDSLPTGDLARGAAGPAVAALTERLRYMGDLAAPRPEPRLDAVLEAALRRYQRRHGLKASGLPDKPTRRSLAVPLADRIAQIELNLERRRWLPREPDTTYLEVNVPAYSLDVVERGRVKQTMRVVVGTPDWSTPVFSDEMSWMEINPSWGVPGGILRYEVLPAFRKDSLYFAKNDLRVQTTSVKDTAAVPPSSVKWEEIGDPKFRFRVLQLPGPTNPLGRVKFLCPNEYSVYLHDTPFRGHFALDMRAQSHGCIRVERPDDLAEFLLVRAAPDSADSLIAWKNSTRTVGVRLPRRVPVHVLYWTSWVDAKGLVQFRDDVYGIDRRLREALARPATFRLNVWTHEDAPGT
jgi:murein L,D-transpeptidase YcbB/YkuD